MSLLLEIEFLTGVCRAARRPGKRDTGLAAAAGPGVFGARFGLGGARRATL